MKSVSGPIAAILRTSGMTIGAAGGLVGFLVGWPLLGGSILGFWPGVNDLILIDGYHVLLGLHLLLVSLILPASLIGTAAALMAQRRPMSAAVIMYSSGALIGIGLLAFGSPPATYVSTLTAEFAFSGLLLQLGGFLVQLSSPRADLLSSNPTEGPARSGTSEG